MRQLLERLAAHLAWADDRALASLEVAPEPPAEALALLGHVLAAEHVWLRRIAGEPAVVPVWPSLRLAECRALAAKNREELISRIAATDDADLERPVRYVNSAGAEFTNTVADILTHVCLHGTYHRGQVALLVRRAGAEPRATDYIAFIRGAPAAKRPNTERRPRPGGIKAEQIP